MKRIWLVLAIIFFGIYGFRKADEILFEKPKGWPEPAYDFKNNPLTKEKFELGRALFYDPILSLNNTISCASCHLQYTGFAHTDHALSHGIGDSIGKRNAPALMNLAWHKSFMWDGAINHLDMQALAPISHPDEMGESIEHVVSKLQASSLYPKLFYHAYGDSIVTGEHLLKSLSQFMLRLVSSDSKYDSVMQKKTTFSVQEKNGYKLFKKNCASCHTEPLFTNGAYENNGLPPDPVLNDIGRAGITKDPTDSFKFKVPTLRNIEFTYPYMHDGRFKKLHQVLNHYTNGINNNNKVSEKLGQPIGLTSNEKVDLIAFLLTLSDKKFLFDQEFSFPRDLLLKQQ